MFVGPAGIGVSVGSNVPVGPGGDVFVVVGAAVLVHVGGGGCLVKVAVADGFGVLVVVGGFAHSTQNTLCLMF